MRNLYMTSVDEKSIGIGKTLQDKLESCAFSFNKLIKSLIGRMLIKQPKHENVKRLQYIVNSITNYTPFLPIDRCHKHIFKKGLIIAKKDASFLYDANFGSGVIKDDEYKSMIYEIINLVRDTYSSLNEDEKEYIWDTMRLMLYTAIQYRLLKKIPDSEI